MDEFEFFAEDDDGDIIVILRRKGDEFLNPDGEDETAEKIGRSPACPFLLKPDSEAPSNYFTKPKAGVAHSDLDVVIDVLRSLGLTHNPTMF